MTTPTHKRCRRSLPASRLRQAVAAAVTGLALADAPANDAMDIAVDEHVLYLDTRVNEATTGKLARFVRRGDVLLASPATLWKLGLRLPAAVATRHLVELPSLAGLSVQYDAPRQRLDLLAPVEMLDHPVTHIDLTRTEAAPRDARQRVPGAVLNYDLYGQRSGEGSNLSSFNELRLFGVGRGVWSNTMRSRLHAGPTKADVRARNTRLDSRWQLDLPESMITLTVGDTTTSALEWSRATRIGGIRLSRNFALQPYRITTPLAAFSGEAVLPSTVDLYIDGIRQSTHSLLPGRFQLDGSPSLNGTGQAQLVITDINGQRRALDFSLYGSPRLLQAGLSDWSLEGGVIRREYGQRSFHYGGVPLASASLRHGMNKHLTLQTHVEGSHGIGQAGAGAVLLLGQRGGVVNGSWASSRAGARTGQQRGLGYQWTSPRFAAAASTLRRSADYRDVAAVHEDATLPRRTEQASLGISTPAGQLGLSYVMQQHPDTSRNRHAGLNWSLTSPGGALLNFSVNRDLTDHRGESAFLYWSMPLDRHTATAASIGHDRGGNSLSVEAHRSARREQGELGWRAQASVGNHRYGARGEISQHGNHGQWTAGLDHDNRNGNSPLLYAGANGGLAWLGGRLHTLPRVDDAFALVSTSGVAGVPVQLENRTVGVTNRHGQLLIPHLTAWQRNQLSIDPLDLPADMLLETVRHDAVPETRSAIQVAFAMRRTLAIQFGVRDRAGQWLPAGSRLTLKAPGAPSVTTLVGHEGKVYLLDPPPLAHLHFRSDSDACSTAVPEAPLREGRINLADVVCQ